LLVSIYGSLNDSQELRSCGDNIGKLENIWKEAFAAQFQRPCRHLIGGGGGEGKPRNFHEDYSVTRPRFKPDALPFQPKAQSPRYSRTVTINTNNSIPVTSLLPSLRDNVTFFSIALVPLNTQKSEPRGVFCHETAANLCNGIIPCGYGEVSVHIAHSYPYL